MIKELFANIQEEEVSNGRLDKASSDYLYQVDDVYSGGVAGMCIDLTKLTPYKTYHYSGLAKKNKAPRTKTDIVFGITDVGGGASFVLTATSTQPTYINEWLQSYSIASVRQAFEHTFNSSVLTINSTDIAADIGTTYKLYFRLFSEIDGQMWELKKLVTVAKSGGVYVITSTVNY